MKKLLALVLALLMLCAVPAAMADSMIQCVNCTVNGDYYWSGLPGTVLTAVADLPNGAVPDYWTINGQPLEGTTDAQSIVFEASGKMTVMCMSRRAGTPAGTPIDAAPAPTSAPQRPVIEGDKTVTAVGAVLEVIDGGSMNADGSIVFDTSVSFTVTAAPAKGQKVDYWVLNGVKYDFYEYRCLSCTVRELTYPLVIEVVYQKADSETLGKVEKDPQLPLTVTTKSAKCCFITLKGKGVGGWMTSFDFTGEYTNPATGKKVSDGTITLRVMASAPKGKRAAGWKINDAIFRFDSKTENFYVYDLDEATVYEPIFVDASVKKDEDTLTHR